MTNKTGKLLHIFLITILIPVCINILLPLARICIFKNRIMLLTTYYISEGIVVLLSLFLLVFITLFVKNKNIYEIIYYIVGMVINVICYIFCKNVMLKENNILIGMSLTAYLLKIMDMYYNYKFMQNKKTCVCYEEKEQGTEK